MNEWPVVVFSGMCVAVFVFWFWHILHLDLFGVHGIGKWLGIMFIALSTF